MKVAYFIGALNRGGAETLVLDVCKRHKEVPYEVICVYRHDGNISDEFKQSGVPLIKIAKTRGMFRYLLDMRKVLKREHVTVVHSQTPSNTLLLAIALRGTGIKIVTTFHGHLFADTIWWKRDMVYKASDKIVCVSEYQKHYYEEKWKLPKENKLQVVYNGIDFTKIDAAVESGKWKVESRGIKLAMVGSFIKGRSQIVVAQALAKVYGVWCTEYGNESKSQKPRIESFDFYFIGRRDEKEAWRYDECVKCCEENGLKNVHFMGNRDDVPSLLKSMDGFVYSTEHDTFGIAVIEAIAAGLPIVVNDWAVMKEVCNLGFSETNKTIRFFRTDDVDDCAQKISKLLINIENHRRALQADCQLAAEAAKEKYSIQNHINQLNRIYQSL